MARIKLAVVLQCLTTLGQGYKSYGDAVPVSFVQGQDRSIETGKTYEGNIELTPDVPYLTLDYEYDLAGIPFFDVASLSAPTQIEVKYAEGFYTLGDPQSDGPWAFSNEDANTFRAETFNISSPGRFQSFFIQGGQRWETIRLLTDTSITFRDIGFNLSSPHRPASELPGHLQFLKELYGEISSLGGIAAEVACVDAGNALGTWEITPEGAYIPGQAPAQSAVTSNFANYSLEFRTKIVRGGTGWRVAAGSPSGPIFILTSEYPEGSTFVNTNRSLVPANTIVFNYGSLLVDRQEGGQQPNFYFPVDFPIHEETWYNISTTIVTEGYNISIDGRHAALVPITDGQIESASGGFSAGSVYAGAIGFGPFQDQIAYVRDVVVTAQNDTVLYSNNMLSDEVPAEYGVATSIASVCLDGAKRDRLIWIGDFYHTVRIIGASTLRWDYITGTFDYDFEWQKPDAPLAGFVPINAPLGSRPEYADVVGSYSGLIDYQDLFMAAIGDYYRLTGDAEWVVSRWENIKKLATARLAFIDPNSGLVAGSEEVPDVFYFLGPANGSAVSGLFAYTYDLLAPVAFAAGDKEAAQHYSQVASTLREKINTELWNEDLGTYSLSTAAPANFSLTGMAWAILSGAANVSRAASTIQRLADLRCGVGYKTNSGDPCEPDTQLAPNPSGFLLEALFKAHRDLGVADGLPVAQALLDDFWSAMVTQDAYSSGASWEYLTPAGAPGLGDYTSLAHPWGGAPTYVMPEYVLGVVPTSPGFATWEVRPLLGFAGLSEARGTVVTPRGEIVVSWEEEGGGVWVLKVSGPKGTTGKIVLFEGFAVDGGGHHERENVEVNGEEKTVRVLRQ